MPPTYKDIQRMTGLSLATISKHFNGGNVLAANRAAIEEAAADLGFRVNEVARSLRTRRSGTVGVLLPALDNDFHLEVIAGVEAVLKDVGVSVVVVSSHTSAAGAAGAVDLLVDRRVDGVIAVPGRHDGEPLRAAAARGLPVVLVDRLVSGLDCDAVVLDNTGASAQVVRHLVEHGHREIAVVTGTPDVWTMRERLTGFRRAMRAAGLPVAREHVVRGPLTVRTGREAVHALLARERRPTAVYATNYELTLGAVVALNEAGVDVPGDVSLVGFDGEVVAQVARPRTSVYVQPVRGIAREAAELMRERLAGDGEGPAPRRRVLAGRFVPGGSVGPPRG
ncbi:LacI family DNA-binding transcriptional regulator [Kineococcus sp. SYSU DK004]|uniref:LacI family DNA-binding transcriptional regulator n=1 Tax=Kineococcus sp. SYSU DK004 TaxID=3383125 RepID=UPI003D7E76BD